MNGDKSGGSDLIRILTVDDHPLLREGIAGLVADQSDMSLVAEASNGREAIQQFRTHRPNVTLMDLQMPDMNGLDAMVSILSEFPEARIIILTTYTGDVQVLRALKAGARGYLIKGHVRRELLDIILSSRGRHTRYIGDWSSDVCSSDLERRCRRHRRYRRWPRRGAGRRP